jgi:hypothetical protein
LFGEAISSPHNSEKEWFFVVAASTHEEKWVDELIDSFEICIEKASILPGFAYDAGCP